MQVRPYRESDYKQVEAVCLGAGDPTDPMMSTPMLQDAVLKVFCHYYIEKEPQHCFVFADNEDKAVGYVLCAADFFTWEKNFRESYLAGENNPVVGMMGEATIEGLRPFADRYPAHLHIDLLPACQRQGAGTKLIIALRSHLASCGVPGVMLSCAKDNEKGLGFYRKLGFTELAAGEREILFGIETGSAD